jgi:cobalt-zinc-cadmium efflux system membrane fusion protein
MISSRSNTSSPEAGSFRGKRAPMLSTHSRWFSRLLMSTLVIGFSLMGCSSGEPPQPPETREAPPSITGSGAKEALIRLTDKQAEELNIQTYQVSLEPFKYELVVPGNVEPSPEHYTQIGAPVNGRVVKIYAHEGEAVKAGDPLVDIESLEFANLAADYLEALAEENYLQQQVQRLKPLVEKQISSQRTLERTQADLTRATARTKASRARLRAVGVRESQMQEWTTEDMAESPVLRVYAPINGSINEHMVDLGQSVNAYQKLLDIIDRREVLVKAYLSPEDGALLQPGDSLHIHTREGNEHRVADVRSVIATLNPALDAQNRSITLNSFVKTVNGWPYVGQQVRVMCEVQSRSPVIGIPLSAVQYEGEKATVFVRREPTVWEKRFIEIERITPNSAIVSSGLADGDDVATSQVFSLKALGKYEEFAD